MSLKNKSSQTGVHGAGVPSLDNSMAQGNRKLSGGGSHVGTIDPAHITALLALFQHEQADNGMFSLNKTEPCEKWLANDFCRFHARGFCKYAHGMADACPREFELHSFKEQFCGKDLCAYSDRCKFVHDEVKFELPHGLKLYYSEKERNYRLVLKSDRSKVLVYKFAASPDMRDLKFYEEYLPIFEEIREKIPASKNFRPANLEKACGQQRSKLWKQNQRRNIRPHIRQNLMTRRGQQFQDKFELNSSNITWVPVLNGQVHPQFYSNVIPQQQTVFYTPPAQVNSPNTFFSGQPQIMSWGNAGDLASTLSNMSLSPQLMQQQNHLAAVGAPLMHQQNVLYSNLYSPEPLYEDPNNLHVVYDPMEQLNGSSSRGQLTGTSDHATSMTPSPIFKASRSPERSLEGTPEKRKPSTSNSTSMVRQWKTNTTNNA